MAFILQNLGRNCITDDLVSILKIGYVNIPFAVIAKYDLEKFEMVRLFYEKNARYIGVHFTNDLTLLGLRKISKSISYTRVACVNFLRDNRVFFNESKRYAFRPILHPEFDDFYIIDLNQEYNQEEILEY